MNIISFFSNIPTISIQFESTMQRNNPISHICISTFNKPNFFHHSLQLLLIKESLNTLDKILIRIFISSQHATHFWDNCEWVLTVDLFEDGIYYFAEL